MRTKNLNRLWKISVFLFGENPELGVLGIGLCYEPICAGSTLKIETREFLNFLIFLLYSMLLLKITQQILFMLKIEDIYFHILYL